MKKRLIIVLIILLNIISLYSLVSPKEDRGGVMGRTSLTFLTDWNNVKKGNKFNRLSLGIRNFNTGKIHKCITNGKGFFNCLNLPDGDYELISYKVKINYSNSYYTVENYFKEPLYFTIEKKTLYVLPTVNLYVNSLSRESSKQVSPQLTNTSYSLQINAQEVDEQEKLIKMFIQKDKKNKWKDYTYVGLEEKETNLEVLR